MAGTKSSGGAGRSFEFTPAAKVVRPFAARRWQAWMFYDDRWRPAPAAMPEGAVASYVDVDHRHAGAICLEALAIGALS